MRPRFHLPELDPASGDMSLGGDEAAHLTRVLRLREGAEIEVFDGRGRMFLARVSAVVRERVSVSLVEPIAAAPEAATSVTLAMCVLKGDKMDDVVRDATMMGVVAIDPIVSARSEVSLATLTRGHRQARWQRLAVSGAKQCGRAVVPDVRPPVNLAAWLRQSAGGTILALVEPSRGAGLSPSHVPRVAAVSLVVGPEGGWTPDEGTALADAGAIALSLGARTLRADAAPVVGLAALYEAWQAW